MSVTPVIDCTGSELGGFTVPAGTVLAGYMTGSPDVIWSTPQFDSHPGTIHIDQSPFISGYDETADVLDYENGAALITDIPPWVNAAWANYRDSARPGQRTPAIYMSASNVSAVVNELLSKGITSGVGLWVANWNLTDPQAIAEVMAASGPFPVIGVQYSNLGTHDVSVFSTAWLQETSKMATPPPPATHPTAPVPPGEWERGAVLTGIGLDGNLWVTVYDAFTGLWSPVQRVSS